MRVPNWWSESLPAGFTVSLSGGNPAIHDLKPLIVLGQAEGYRFALETQGSLAKDWFADLNVLTLSPKPPSSGMEVDWDVFDQCFVVAGAGPEIVLKFVIMNEGDYGFARSVAARYPDIPVYLQPCNVKPSPDQVCLDGMVDRLRWLTDKVLQDGWFEARVLPQLHVMMWGNKRGV